MLSNFKRSNNMANKHRDHCQLHNNLGLQRSSHMPRYRTLLDEDCSRLESKQYYQYRLPFEKDQMTPYQQFQLKQLSQSKYVIDRKKPRDKQRPSSVCEEMPMPATRKSTSFCSQNKLTLENESAWLPPIAAREKHSQQQQEAECFSSFSTPKRRTLHNNPKVQMSQSVKHKHCRSHHMSRSRVYNPELAEQIEPILQTELQHANSDKNSIHQSSSYSRSRSLISSHAKLQLQNEQSPHQSDNSICSEELSKYINQLRARAKIDLKGKEKHNRTHAPSIGCPCQQCVTINRQCLARLRGLDCLQQLQARTLHAPNLLKRPVPLEQQIYDNIKMSNPFFRLIGRLASLALLRIGSLFSLPINKSLYYQQQISKSIYVLLHGIMQLKNQDGVLLKQLHVGDALGESQFFENIHLLFQQEESHGREYRLREEHKENAKAKEKVWLLKVSKKKYWKMGLRMRSKGQGEQFWRMNNLFERSVAQIHKKNYKKKRVFSVLVKRAKT